MGIKQELGRVDDKVFHSRQRSLRRDVRRCGKEMCENCFAYGGHSGICPSCLWMEYLAERDCLEEEQRGFRRGIVGWALFAAGLCWTVAGLIYGICKINRKCRRKKEGCRKTCLSRRRNKENRPRACGWRFGNIKKAPDKSPGLFYLPINTCRPFRRRRPQAWGLLRGNIG